MFLDQFLSNSWDSNNDFNIESFNKDTDAHAKLINDSAQLLTSKNLQAIDIAKQTIVIDLSIVDKMLSQTAEGLRTTIKNFSSKINTATLKFYNQYVGIQNTTYKAGLNAAGGTTRIDYDGNAVAFIDSMLEAFDELMSELNGFGIETETITENLLQSINSIASEYQRNMEKTFANMESAIAENGETTLSLITDANASYKQGTIIWFQNFTETLASVFNQWLSSMGSRGSAQEGGFVSQLKLGMLEGMLEFGGWM